MGKAVEEAIQPALEDVVSALGLSGTVLRSWRVLRSEQVKPKPVFVRDIVPADGTAVICALLCIAGTGFLSIANPSDKEKPAQKMHKIELQRRHCLLYNCNVTYAIHQSPAAYFHCVFADETSPLDVMVYHPIQFPCPYNKTSQSGDVRGCPRSYSPENPGLVDCSYRGARWNNVLDHLVNCKANPSTDRHEYGERRRARNNTPVVCDKCGRRLNKKNSLTQHKLRKHRPMQARIDTPAVNIDNWTTVTEGSGSVKEGSQTYLEEGALRGGEGDDIDELTPSLIVAVRETASTVAAEVEDDGSLEDNFLDWLLPPPVEGSNAVSLFTDHSNLYNDSAAKRRKLIRRHTSSSSRLPIEIGNTPLLEQFEMCFAENDEESSELEPLPTPHTHQLVRSMLAPISKADVRQPAGRMEHNAGEIAMEGVTALLTAFGDITPGDVFADIGSGIGNVCIQVALESRVGSSIGVEMRNDLTTLMTNTLAKHKSQEPRLAKIVVITADITQVDIFDLPEMLGVTHVFSHNTLFDPNTMLKLESICMLPKLQRIALSLPPCTRHSHRCEKWFCRMWTLESTIQVPVTHKDGLVDIYIFTRMATVL